MHIPLESKQVTSAVFCLLKTQLSHALESGNYVDRLFCQIVLDAPSAVEDILKKEQQLVIDHFTLKEPDFLNGPFNSLVFSLAEKAGWDNWRRAFEHLALEALALPCSPEGAWLHSRGNFGDGGAVLLDSFQEEASRLVKLAGVLRKKNQDQRAGALEEQAVNQFRIHRRILRNPTTGLWHNGRGWGKNPLALSPGAWSRGHGWLLRGLVDTATRLPDGPLREEITQLHLETIGTLLSFRNKDGLWPVLLNRWEEGSPSETSGSAMIAAAILRAHRLELPLANGAVETALVCVDRLAENRWNETGQVLQVSPGPGPLVEEETYCSNVEWGDNAHGAFALLDAALERVAFCRRQD